MARERVRGQMHARQLAHDRAYRVRTRLGCAGVSCVQAHSGPSWTPARLLLTDHRRRVGGSRPPGDSLPGGVGASGRPGCTSVGLCVKHLVTV
jgi:hypothetical protein